MAAANTELVAEIDQELERQRKWRAVMSGAYFTTAGVAIFCSVAATVAAGMGHSAYAAYLAGGASVLLGLEKGLLFREKWSHHLATFAQLESLRLQLVYGHLPVEDASLRMGQILTDYAIKLPVSSRKDPQDA
jgi:hypothetical protein